MEAMEYAITDNFKNYDVFISHRGPDTKTGFVSFLYKDLVAAGLQPFLDCKSIDIGEDAWECIEDAIKKTPIAIVIFTESFAQSEWCLKELHVMLESPCIEVLPIFYKIQPWELRRPHSGQLRDGFEKLEKRHDKRVIDQWRADLEKASKILGWIHSAAPNSLEGDLVEKIVAKISALANKRLPLDVGECVVGVKQVAEEIIQALHDKKKVLMLGLWGMGGIGKSTLARELYNQLGKRFTASCYVEDVTEKVNQGGVVKVQNCILKDLCMNGSMQIEDKSKGKVILEERLRKSRFLLVLDDVCGNDEMDYWITRKMLTEGSLCIVTSRNSRVFEKSNSFDVNHEIYVHDVQLLSSEDSKRVFTCYAFGGDCKVKRGFEKLAANISIACGGVPLVLKVCGALLREEENVEIWEEVMEKLNCGTIMDENKIFDCLQISYDALQHQHQEMFLDIACALLGQSEDMARRVWKSHGWSPALGIRSLKEKALVTVDGQGCFSMHDLLREMGREIVRKKRASEGVCRRLWMPESITLLEEDEPLPDSLQTLVIKNRDYMDRNGFPVVHLDVSHMKELRILICDDAINVTSVPVNLRWFHWHERGLKYGDWKQDEDGGLIRPVGNMLTIAPKNNKLVVLDICHRFHRLQSVNKEIHFKFLQVLYLRNYGSPGTSFGDVILQSKDLEDLDLSWNKLYKLPEEFGSLGKLSSLCLNYCYDLEELPNSLGQLTRLKNLSLVGYRQHSADDNSMSTISEIKNLCNLTLAHSDIGSLPESFGKLSNLEVLNMSSCKKLKRLPDSFGGLRNLRDLDLAYSQIETLPESFGKLSNLEVLNLSDCLQLIMLPDSFGGLGNLRVLNLGWTGIESLPKSFGELSNLEELSVGGAKFLVEEQNVGGSCVREVFCRKLIMLPDSFGGLNNLRDLTLMGPGIRSLPESFGELGSLERLYMRECSEFIMLRDSFGGLKNLRELVLEWSGIESLPKSFGKLTNLEVLDLVGCEKLIMLPDSFGSLKNLRSLNLPYSGIKILPESFVELSNLEELDLTECSELIMLPDSFGRLRNLRTLDLGKTGIESLPESFGKLKNLRDLNLSCCPSLHALPHSFTQLTNLQKLDLRSCPACHSIKSLHHLMPASCEVSF